MFPFGLPGGKKRPNFPKNYKPLDWKNYFLLQFSRTVTELRALMCHSCLMHRPPLHPEQTFKGTSPYFGGLFSLKWSVSFLSSASEPSPCLCCTYYHVFIFSDKNFKYISLDWLIIASCTHSFLPDCIF
jgi:hypothetical protein